MLKRVLCLFFAFFIFLFSAGCLKFDTKASKDEVFDFVMNHKNELSDAINNKDFSNIEKSRIVANVFVKEDSVDFECGGSGFGSGTSYVGFFYSANDNMCDVWCAPSSEEYLVKCGHGFEWQEETDDDRYYVEKICDKFYYYEASF